MTLMTFGEDKKRDRCDALSLPKFDTTHESNTAMTIAQSTLEALKRSLLKKQTSVALFIDWRMYKSNILSYTRAKRKTRKHTTGLSSWAGAEVAAGTLPSRYRDRLFRIRGCRACAFPVIGLGRSHICALFL